MNVYQITAWLHSSSAATHTSRGITVCLTVVRLKSKCLILFLFFEDLLSLTNTALAEVHVFPESLQRKW